VFDGRIELTGEPGIVIPSVTGTAYVTAEATLLVDAGDPLKDGIRA
jgi:4-hydroxyproline epimerase